MDQNFQEPLKREKQEWRMEKPKLDNARRPRGTYFIDPEDGQFKETVKKRKKKVGSSNGGYYACKKKQQRSTPGFGKLKRSDQSNKIPKTKHACIVEASGIS